MSRNQNDDRERKDKKLEAYDARLFNQQKQQIPHIQPFLDQISQPPVPQNVPIQQPKPAIQQPPQQPQQQPQQQAQSAYFPQQHQPPPWSELFPHPTFPVPLLHPQQQSQHQHQHQHQPHQPLQGGAPRHLSYPQSAPPLYRPQFRPLQHPAHTAYHGGPYPPLQPTASMDPYRPYPPWQPPPQVVRSDTRIPKMDELPKGETVHTPDGRPFSVIPQLNDQNVRRSSSFLAPSGPQHHQAIYAAPHPHDSLYNAGNPARQHHAHAPDHHASLPSRGVPIFESPYGSSTVVPKPAPASLNNSAFLEKVVHKESIAMGGSHGQGEENFERTRNDSSSSSSSGSSAASGGEQLINHVYNETYLRSLMKNLGLQTQESSDAEYIKLCYALELECCHKKSDGTAPYICDPLEGLLLSKFVFYTAPWLDVMCHVPFFTKYLVQLSLFEEGMMIHNCLLSCGALFLHRDQPDKFDAKFALKYYNAALKLLSMDILQNERVLTRCLVSSILLNHYEDFAGQVQNKFNHHTGSRIILQEILSSDHNYKKNKKRNTSTSTTTSNTLSTSGTATASSTDRQTDLGKWNSLKHNEFLETMFWVITSSDLQESLKWGAPTRWSLQNPNTTVLALSHSIDFDEKISEYVSNQFDVDFKKVGAQFFNSKNQLWWLRKSVYNLQLVNDYCFQPYVLTLQEYNGNAMAQKWIELKKSTDIFGKFIPAALRKIIFEDATAKRKSRFPHIFFKDTQAALINLNYHLSCFFLYDSLINRSGLFSTDPDEKASCGKILNANDREFLTHKKNLKKLLKQHAVSIMGILNSYHGDNVVWSLSLGHFKVAFRYLRKYKEFHEELGQLITDIQVYTKTRFNKF